MTAKKKRQIDVPDGVPTAPAYRGNVFASQGLSKQYIPNRRGPRADVPAWSVRETVSFQTKA